VTKIRKEAKHLNTEIHTDYQWKWECKFKQQQQAKEKWRKKLWSVCVSVLLPYRMHRVSHPLVIPSNLLAGTILKHSLQDTNTAKTRKRMTGEIDFHCV